MRVAAILIAALFAPTAAGLAIGIADGEAEGFVMADPARADRGQSPVVLWEDPAGDAQQWTGDRVAGDAVDVPCGALGLRYTPAGPACDLLDDEANGLEGVGGLPASGAFDLLSSSVSVTPEELVFALEVAELPADLSEIDPTGATRAILWFSAIEFEDGASAGLEISLILQADEPALVFSYSGVCEAALPNGSECEVGCNYWWWCPSRIDGTIEPGSPGRFVAHVPWDVFGTNASRLHVAATDAYVRRNTLPTDSVDSGTSAPTYEDGPEGLRVVPWRVGWNSAETVDRASGGAAALPGADAQLTGLPSTFPTTAGAWEPAMDIQSISFIEEPQRLGFQVRLGHVAADPGSEYAYVAFATPTGPVADVWYETMDGERQPLAFIPVDVNYTDYVPLPVELEVAAGTPGDVTFWFDRSSFWDLEAGSRVQFLMAASGDQQRRPVVDLGAGGTVYTGPSVGRPGDYSTGGSIPLQWSSEGKTPVNQPTIQDALGDATAPLPTWDDDMTARFDIEAVNIEPVDESTTRVDMWMANFDSVEVPDTFHAFVYTVSASSADGAYMAGYYKHTDGATEYFCSQDTLGFTAELQDPRNVVWQPIEGRYLFDTAPSQAFATGAGGIVLHVPHECLGLSNPGPTEIPDVQAGTYLLRDTELGTDVVAVDAAASEDPVVFGAQPVAAAPADASTPWHATPFGVENFWDIAGITFAVLAAILGALLIRRRRRHLSQFLKSMEDAQRIRDPARREQTLAGVRPKVHEAFQRGRLTDGQFTLLDRRLDAAVGQARLDRLGPELGHLPYAIVTELERMLKDGSISTRELTIMEALVDKADLPAAKRRRVLSQLQSWATA